jgi:hypothetical protein
MELQLYHSFPVKICRMLQSFWTWSAMFIGPVVMWAISFHEFWIDANVLCCCRSGKCCKNRWKCYYLIPFVTWNLIGSFDFTNILHIVWKTVTIYSRYMMSNKQSHNTIDSNVFGCCYSDIDPQCVQVIDSIEIIYQIMSKTIYWIRL